MELAELLEVPPARAAGLGTILSRLEGAERVVLTTHVNADGDGAGSEAAVAAWLEARGVAVTIVNPTPFPEVFRFLLHRPDVVQDLDSERGRLALARHDVAIVLDTSEANRVAPLVSHLDPERTLVVDHHPPGPTVVGGAGVQDPTAAATGELVYDILRLSGDEWPHAAVQGVYVAIVSDTGSFRFSNTTPRTHAVAAEMLARGADAERVFQRLFATFPQRRFDLLREALGTLTNEPDLGLSWMTVSADVTRDVQASHQDFEGLIDHARSVSGTRVAVLFREMEDGTIKISFRSNGDVDVNRIARRFGGGGHARAAGASISGDRRGVVETVLGALRTELQDAARQEF